MGITGAFVVPHPPIILPEIGHGREKEISATIKAYESVAERIAALKPETVVIISPHAPMYSDYIHISGGDGAGGDFYDFGAGQVKENAVYDERFVAELCSAAASASIPAGVLGERKGALDHGTLIPLRFINKAYTGFKTVRIGLSGLPLLKHYEFGMLIKAAAQKLGRKTVIVASGDLSHKLAVDGPYGFAPQGPQFDKKVTDALSEGDFLQLLSLDEDFCEAAAECGLRSMVIMAGALDRTAVKSQLLSYEGPFGVGYGTAAFEVAEIDEKRNFGERFQLLARGVAEETRQGEDSYTALARQSLEWFVKNGERLVRPDGLPKEMINRMAGVFVSIKKFGRLRGCIGTIAPTTQCIADEIIQNAVSAGLEDPRFDSITEGELDDLNYSVDVLSAPEKIESEQQLDVCRYGVIVYNGRRRGLLLPNLEGIDTVKEQIDIARQKAGIEQGEQYSLQRFEVVRHK